MHGYFPALRGVFPLSLQLCDQPLLLLQLAFILRQKALVDDEDGHGIGRGIVSTIKRMTHRYVTISWMRVCSAFTSTSRYSASLSKLSSRERRPEIAPMTTGPERRPSIWYNTFEKGMNAQ